ncbi:GNAT family N-acetyltransferase [Actinocatenispora rupis]|uniref:Acetyltransferase n=1 Tax=Actinocatenispora rupis TaxID=519421 RepID=A0A8J3NA18_9ACTN|nr:GNAT family N-acetyltransferase [Actinocatenispora rupis]GID09260.1 acetyltransferase [Actinocatenispora rupis]
MTLVHWAPEDLLARLDDVLTVYAEAMEYPADLVAARRGFVAAHTHYQGFRAVATLDNDDRLLGFSYGYLSSPGQWWHEQVRSGLSRGDARRWLSDCFELVELHVRPDAQGHGLGYTQLGALLEGATEATVLLSTPEAPQEDSRAWRLYRRTGFTDVLRHFHFPGDDRPFAVLGRALPLD